MFDLRIVVSEVKYNVLAQKIFVLRAPSKKPPLWLINVLDKLVTAKFMNKIVVKVFNKNKTKIIDELGKRFLENNIPLKINEIYCTYDKKLEAEILIEDIDYNNLFASVYPLIERKLKDDKKIGEIFTLYGEYIFDMISAALDVLPPDKKDEIVMYLVNRFTLSFFNKLLKNNQFGVRLGEVSVQKQFNLIPGY